MAANTRLFLDLGWPESPALAALKTAAAIRVLLLFCKKRRIEKEGRRGHEKYRVTNNGEITFTFDEARERFGMSKDVFSLAIAELRRVGFIDCAYQGAGGRGDPSKYAFSDRWQRYGKDDFQPEAEPSRSQYHRGFKKNNDLQRRRAEFSHVAGAT